MEKVRSIRKSISERTVEKAIAPIFKSKKIRINFEEDPEKVFNNLTKYYCNSLFKRENETDVQVMERLVNEFSNYGVKCTFEKVEDSSNEYKSVINALLRYNYTKNTRPKIYNWSIYKVEMLAGEIKYEYFTTLDIKISKKFRGAKFTSGISYFSFNVMDTYRLLAEHKIAHDIQEYISANKKFMTRLAAEELSYLGMYENVESRNEICYYCNQNNINIPKIITRNTPTKRILGEALVRMFFGERIFKVSSDIYNDEYYKKNRLEITNIKLLYLSRIIFREMANDFEDLEIEAYYENENETEYARAFETKKHINKSVEKLMSQSKFKTYFNYVEYDNETDKEKILTIEDEFLKVSNELGFYNMDTYIKNPALRFRKLGKHKASGLYWPTHNCVCIDLDGIHSTMHECLHMLDYTLLEKGYIRDLIDFRVISRKYMQVLDNACSSLEDGHPFKNTYYGKTKFNRNYYKNNAEIFARCGEIYLKRCLNLESSLLNDCTDIVYPLNEELKELINNFYSKYVFTEVGKEKGKTSNKVNIFINEDVRVVEECTGQLMLAI